LPCKAVKIHAGDPGKGTFNISTPVTAREGQLDAEMAAASIGKEVMEGGGQAHAGPATGGIQKDGEDNVSKVKGRRGKGISERSATEVAKWSR
jgi:hypothetical protein